MVNASRDAVTWRGQEAQSMPTIPGEVLEELRSNLAHLCLRDPERRTLVARTAFLFHRSEKTVYRQLAQLPGPKRCTRKDQGHARYPVESEFRRWIEMVAAIKLATLNRKGRHLSTAKAIALAEDGVYLEGRFEHIPKGALTRACCDRWMATLGITLRQRSRPEPCVRFEAQESHACWQFDVSISDAHYLAEQRALPEAGQSGYPHLALFSVVDDHSRVNYQEYHLVYGEEVEAALLFLFHAMAPKDDPAFPFQGIPAVLYMDNGPLAKSRVFHRVLEEKLGIEVKVHDTPQQGGRRRTAARAKGKVERCFRTVKESFETLFHFHKPDTPAEANQWLFKHLLHYNSQQHPTQAGSRIEVWARDLPAVGFRQMCAWDTYCTFAREPEFRTVGLDGRISLENRIYQITPELSGERVEVWKGVFDLGVYVQDQGGSIHGPYAPESGIIPFGTYRRWRKTERDRRLEKVEHLAEGLAIPRASMSRDWRTAEERSRSFDLPSVPFANPIGLLPEQYASMKEARRGIFGHFGIPLATLPEPVLGAIEAILRETLHRRDVYRRVKALLQPHHLGDRGAHGPFKDLQADQ
jgi:hypothetical protein